MARTPFDAEDLPAALAAMREDAQRLEPDNVFSKLVLPNDQIRYLTAETGDLPAEERIVAARRALEGATPYPVAELAFDISTEGGLTHIAAVALETLDEAETFAVEHGFGPVSFVAAPETSGFRGEPFFGTTRAIRGTEVEPDKTAVSVIGPAALPDPAADNSAEDQVARPAEGTAAQAQPPQPSALPADTAKPETEGTAPALDAELPDQPGVSGRRTPEKAAQAPTPAEFPPAPPPAKTDGKPVQQAAGFASRRSDAGPAANKAVPPVSAPNAALAAKPVPAPPAAAKPLGAATAALAQGTAKPPAPGPAIPPAPAALREAPRAAAARPETPAAGKAASRGKPRYLGVILTVLLLLMMASVAVWALFGEDSFFTAPPANEQHPAAAPAAGPGEEQTDGSAGPQETPRAVQDPAAGGGQSAIAPQVSVLADQPDPGLQDTWADASGQDPSAEDEATADGVELPEDGTDTAFPDGGALQSGGEDEASSASSPADAAGTGPVDELAQAARYAATGIWPVAPDLGALPSAPDLDGLYTASVDRTEIAADAVALPQPESFLPDQEPGAIASPAAAGSAFALDSRGLVKASPEGTVNPDGIVVYLGRPDAAPPRAPERSDPAAEALAETVARNQVLSRKRPMARPSDLEEQVERAQLGGLSRAELASLRPRQRPASLKPAEEEQLPATAQAIAASVVPRGRPANFANLVDRARRNTQNQVQTAAAVPAAAAAAAPSIPTSASVARRATVGNAINLRKLNLIGVYGTASDRRALVRLPSGRYKKVQVGDRVDGGRVIAIGESQLQYQKGGRNRTLTMPNG